MDNSQFKDWFESLPAENPRDGEEWAFEAWNAALELAASRIEDKLDTMDGIIDPKYTDFIAREYLRLAKEIRALKDSK